MMFGRFIYGVGAECSGVAYSAIISKWFRGKELNFCGIIMVVLDIYAENRDGEI